MNDLPIFSPIATYPAVYRDAQGEISCVLENDGKRLRLRIDDVFFEGIDFDSFEPMGASPERFQIADGSLCACTLLFSIPITIGSPLGDHSAELHVVLHLGPPRLPPRGSIEYESLQLTLALADKHYVSRGTSGWFEDELVDIQKQLPQDFFLKICFGCGFSDYHPGGHGLFGGMGCFRTNKEGYRALDTQTNSDFKTRFFEVWDKGVEYVQETHLCPEFERRRPGTGYRG